MKQIGNLQAYEIAKKRYADLGIDTEVVLSQMEDFHLSFGSGGTEILCSESKSKIMHEAELLRQDFQKAMKLVPGKHRLCIPPSWNRQDGSDTLTEIESWMQWSRSMNVPLDMQVTTKNADHELTLANRNPDIRHRWIDYLEACRLMADKLGENQKNICVMNIKLEDQLTEPSYNRLMYCQLLEESLTLLYKGKKKWMRDSLESPVHNILRTPVIPASLLVSLAKKYTTMITLCLGEDGISYATLGEHLAAILPSALGLSLQLRKPSRRTNLQQSLMDENMVSLLTEIINSGLMRRIHYAIDYQLSGLSRSESYVIAARSVQRCQLRALLEPIQTIHYYELNGLQYEKTLLAEEARSLPWGAVYDEFCQRHDIPYLA